MHEVLIEKYHNAAELPSDWDGMASCIFQRRTFLQHAEQYNPCKQRYYLLWENDSLAAGACVYTLSIDLFTFSGIPSPLRMYVIGLPASVAAPGIFGQHRAAVEELIRHILQAERGLVVGLNLEPGTAVGRGIEMNMLPTVVTELPFDTWDAYFNTLRSHYRRRAAHVLERFHGVMAEHTACSAYNQEHHRLYRQIMRRTPSKLETLSLEFFQNLPADFYLTTYYAGKKMLCWHICARDGSTLYFFFGGHDYKRLKRYQSYFNNLYGIIREAVAEDRKSVV